MLLGGKSYKQLLYALRKQRHRLAQFVSDLVRNTSDRFSHDKAQFVSDKRYVLLGGKSYVVGRRDCDILLAGDPTVSRKHAELTMSHTEANLVRICISLK